MKLRVAAVLVFAVLLLTAPWPADASTPGEPHLPDLVTIAPAGVRLETGGGVRRLFFSNTIGNIGAGPLELRPIHDAAAGTTDAVQELYTHPRGSLELQRASRTVVGTFVFHPAHSHWHLENFANYGLYAIEEDGTTGALLAATEKVSFCMIDTTVIDSSIRHFGWGLTHNCGQRARQGVQVGMGDTYSSFLPDQFVDISGLAFGTYRLLSIADPPTVELPGGNLIESNDTNNAASVDVTIRRSGVTIVPGSQREGVEVTPTFSGAAVAAADAPPPAE